MIRLAMTLCFVMTACQPGEPPTDAAVMFDAMVPADAPLHDASQPDASMVVSAAYALTWACQDNCFLDTPFRYQDRMHMLPASATLWRSSCGPVCDGNIDVALVAPDGECSRYTSSGAVNADLRVCPDGLSITGTLLSIAPAGTSTWSLTGSPVCGGWNESCCADGAACDAIAVTGDQLRCDELTAVCTDCGIEGQSCCPSEPECVEPGQTCIDGLCER